jgi:hypothetical protein
MAARLKDLLLQDVTRYSPRTAAAGTPKDVDPVTMEKLASLGYLAISKGSPGMAVGKNLPDPKDRIDVYELICAGTLAARNANHERAVRLLAEAINQTHNVQLEEGMEAVPSALRSIAYKYVGSGHGGYVLYLFTGQNDRDQFVEKSGAMAIEPFLDRHDGPEV